MWRAGFAAFVMLAGSAAAQVLSLPKGAKRSFAATRDPGAYDVPIGPWTAAEGLPTDRVEGRIRIEAWHLRGATNTPFQLVQPLRDSLTEAGYDIVLDCNAASCGGFDFRFGTLVLPAPEMFVTLTDFHFVTARKAGSAVTLLASRGDRRSYLQIIRAGAPEGTTKTDAKRLTPLPSLGQGDVQTALDLAGHAVLGDVVFASGSTKLGAGPFATLEDLATYLRANPGARVMLVGHTDATGSLDANRKVSLARARAVMAYLVDKGIAPKQLSAEGAGFAAPIASNLTADGRKANRRVEAVLLALD